MNYYALDEALAMLEGNDIDIFANIEATLEAGNIIDGIVINESGSIKEFIQKAIEAIKKLISWISTKVEGIINKAIDKVKTLTIRKFLESAKKKAEKNGNTDKLDEVLKKEYTIAYPMKTGFNILSNGTKDTRNTEERREDVENRLFNEDYIRVVEDTIENLIDPSINKEVIDNYVYAKNYLKKQQITFETDRKNFESLLKKADNDFDKAKISKDLADTNNKIETVKALCSSLLECIKYDFKTYDEMINDLKAV